MVAKTTTAKVATTKVATKTTTAKTTTTKATAKPASKTTTKAAAAKTVYVDVESVGFRAGDVYQTLAAAQKALTVAEIAQIAKIQIEDVYLGIGWLLKEGKVAAENNKVVLA